MLRQCVILAVLGCAVARPQQYQQAEVPPHLLRQYLAAQQQAQAQTQVIPSQHHSASAPARLPYAVQQEEEQYQQPQPQYRPAPQQYRPAPQPQPQYRPAPQQQQQYRPAPQQYRPQSDAREPQEDYDPHPSYQFGFDVNDDQYTNYQNRKEQRDGDVIKGSYSVVDSDGFIRTVTYTADPKEGFKAEVSRQPTDIVVKIPTPKPQTLQPHSQPQLQHQQQQRPQQAPPQYYRYEQ